MEAQFLKPLIQEKKSNLLDLRRCSESLSSFICDQKVDYRISAQGKLDEVV